MTEQLRPVPRAVPEVRSSVDLPIMLPDHGVTAGRIFTFSGLADTGEHIAIGLGPYRDPTGGAPLVRMHSECLTGDVFASRRCDCGDQLRECMSLMAQNGGYVLYLRQEGRGIGLYAKIDAYLLQDTGLDTYQANRALGFQDDLREYAAAVQMLSALGVSKLDLLTGNPRKAQCLSAAGVVVRRTIPTAQHWTPENARYLAAKQAHGHAFAQTPTALPDATQAGGTHRGPEGTT